MATRAERKLKRNALLVKLDAERKLKSEREAEAEKRLQEFNKAHPYRSGLKSIVDYVPPPGKYDPKGNSNEHS